MLGKQVNLRYDGDKMDRIERYADIVNQAYASFLSQPDHSGILQLCGPEGMGKTTLARHCANTGNGGMYFSFHHLDAALAPKIFMSGCSNWESFFAKIRTAKKRPVIFFDDVDARNDKEKFFKSLCSCLDGKLFVVFICRKEMTLPCPSRTLKMKAVTVPELCGMQKGFTKVDALRLTALTNGIPSLLSQYQIDKSYEENIRTFFTPGSPFLRYTPDFLHDEFRSPESYNTLLYGMAVGHNRISQLAEFSGYPKNKCDKYLKALAAVGLTEQRQKKDKAGQLRTHYYPQGGYWKVWYRCYFPRQTQYVKPLSDEALQDLIAQIDKSAVIPLFRKLCFQWLREHRHTIYWDVELHLENLDQYDVIINGCPFDFVQFSKDWNIYVKIWDSTEEGFPKEAFRQIETATTALQPFYENIYVLFSVGRVCHYIEALRELENVRIVELNSLFGKKNMEIFEQF